MAIPESAVRLIDTEHLLKLRLVVGRFGEMDRARWWNTQGVLGKQGTMLLRRGLPKTHWFAQARVVFEAARQRCKEVYDLPDAITLWNLPAAVEEQFEDAWHDWLNDIDRWRTFFEKIAASTHNDLGEMLVEFGLVSDDQLATVASLKRIGDGRAVAIPGISRLDSRALSLLAAGFTRGEPGRLTIPFVRRDELVL